MVDYKAVIADPKTGKSYSKNVEGHYANALVGKRIGEVLDGIFVGLPGYKLKITGGSDFDGVPMRKDLPGPKRRKVLVSESTGFHPEDDGVRRRRSLRGNTVSPDITQVNFIVNRHGPKSIEDLFKEEEQKEENK